MTTQDDGGDDDSDGGDGDDDDNMFVVDALQKYERLAAIKAQQHWIRFFLNQGLFWKWVR